MSAERRRIIAVVAALTAFAAVGVVWLARLVAGGDEARFVPAATPPPATDVVAAPGTGEETPETTGAAPPETTTTTVVDPVTGETTTVTRTVAPRTTTTGASTVTATAPGTRTPRSTAPRSTAPRTSSAPKPGKSSRPPPPPPVPTHAILVGGAKLDNDSPRTTCATFVNTQLGVRATVTGVSVDNDVLDRDAGGCGEQTGYPECRDGRKLATGGGCFAEFVADTDEVGRYEGTVSLGLRVVCTSVGTPACDVAVLRDDPPTVDRPAVLTWSQTGATVCYEVREPRDPDNPFC